MSANGREVRLTAAEAVRLRSSLLAGGQDWEVTKALDLAADSAFELWRSCLPGDGGKVLLDTTTVRNALLALETHTPTPLALLDLATLSTALVCYDYVVIQSADLALRERLAGVGGVFLELPEEELQKLLLQQCGHALHLLGFQDGLRERLERDWEEFLGWPAGRCQLDVEQWDREQHSPPDWDGIVASMYMDDFFGIPADGPKREIFLGIQTVRTFANDAVANNLGIPYLAAPFRAPVQSMLIREKHENQRAIEKILQAIGPQPVNVARTTDEPYSRQFSAPFVLGLILRKMQGPGDYWHLIAEYRERFRPLREQLERDRCEWDGNIGPYARKLIQRACGIPEVLTQGEDIAVGVTTAVASAVAPWALLIKFASLYQPARKIYRRVQQRCQPHLYLINSLRGEAECLKAADWQVKRVWGCQWNEHQYKQLDQLRASNPLPLLRMGTLD